MGYHSHGPSLNEFQHEDDVRLFQAMGGGHSYGHGFDEIHHDDEFSLSEVTRGVLEHLRR